MIFVYNWSLFRLLFINVTALTFVYIRRDYSYQCSRDGERLGGRNTPAEQLRRRLRDGFLEARLRVEGSGSGWLVFPISKTVGGRSWRPRAAASGKAASMATRVSGR